ncbi:ferritin-like protein [Streptomyces sp. NPDC048825]|uniref:ferritin-like domain-containing protein n=1 Tax=Streptomyces sp. NPDC048825 TaxID=3365592 RepID=UPI0037209D78
MTTRTTAGLPFTIEPLVPVNSNEPIQDYETLVNHLHQAAQVEMSTIPMYLYAAYSIQTKGHNQWLPGISAFRTIVAIAIEEMLHLCLVRNLLVALGAADRITFNDKHFIPSYPSKMLHRVPDLELHLQPCSPELMRDVFLPLELPAEHHAPAQPDQYQTLGQFYRAIEDGLVRVDRAEGSRLWQYAKDSTAWQYQRAYWNRDGGGEPILITDLTTAREALQIVVEQGEGVDPAKATVPIDPVNPTPGLDELSHYARFLRIQQGIEPIGNVRNVPVDPKVRDFDEPAASLAQLFNAAYFYTLAMLDKLYNLPATFAAETANPRYHLERTFVSAMSGLLYPIADLLMQTPATKLDPDPATVPVFAAPTFEFYDFPAEIKKSGSHTMKQHLMWLCNQAIAHFPELGGDNSVHWLIDKMPDIDQISSQPPTSRPQQK